MGLQGYKVRAHADAEAVTSRGEAILELLPHLVRVRVRVRIRGRVRARVRLRLS